MRVRMSEVSWLGVSGIVVEEEQSGDCDVAKNHRSPILVSDATIHKNRVYVRRAAKVLNRNGIRQRQKRRRLF